MITKDTFPLGVPVLIETMIDREAGWEFDAPMEIMSPFRLFRETGSIGPEAVEAVLEDLLIDFDCNLTVEPDCVGDDDDDAALHEIFSKVRGGRLRKRWAYYRTTVVVNRWTSEDESIDADWTITTELANSAPSF